MARTFRRQRQAHAIADLNVTNLIDLGFTLLIIFMIATPLITQEQTTPVDLPVTSRQQQAKPDPAQIILRGRRRRGRGGGREWRVAHAKLRISARLQGATRHPSCPVPAIRLVAHSGLGV